MSGRTLKALDCFVPAALSVGQCFVIDQLNQTKLPATYVLTYSARLQPHLLDIQLIALLVTPLLLDGLTQSSAAEVFSFYSVRCRLGNP
jgi:hypothetical protein